MKVCIIASQLLGFEKIGGFGSMTRQLATHLQANGVGVSVAVPRRKGDPDTGSLGGIPLYFVSRRQMMRGGVFREIDADIYHSQHQTILSRQALKAQPGKRHIVTCRDPRDLSDWWMEWHHATWRRKWKTPAAWLLEESPLAAAVLRKVDLVAVPAKFLIPKVRRLYRLAYDPLFLPNLEEIPREIPEKDPSPSAIWIGRFSRRKNPEAFLRLAAEMPEVTFHLIGRSEEARRQDMLEQWTDRLPNVKYHGFLNKFSDPAFYRLLGRAWIFINTASREGLPLTFIEAAGRGCAILSSLDPDGFVSRGGALVPGGDWKGGVWSLLKEDRWRGKGATGFEYVLEVYAVQRALEAHLRIYEGLLSGNSFR